MRIYVIKPSYLLIWLCLALTFLMATSSTSNLAQRDFQYDQQQWADSVLQNMTLDEKIGQLFMLAAYSNRNEDEYRAMEDLVRRYHIGGVIFFQGTPLKQAELTNRYQAAARIPLMIGIDAEWGLGMRLDDAMSFPRQITLGAIQDEYLIEQMGEEIGRQCKRLGVHINFSPVADINTNPMNPVINYRSFGEQKDNVARKAAAYARGMRRAGVMGSAKHFPGHGDTDVDSHVNMPVVPHTEQELFENELFPFQQLIADSIAGVMVGHLFVPGVDSRPNRSGTVSDRIVTKLLKEKLGYQGLIITDALNMRGLTRYYTNGEAELEAFKAGNDILLQSPNVGIAFSRLKRALEAGEVSTTELDARVFKILKAKYWAGLWQYKPVNLSNLLPELNTQSAQQLKERLFEKAATVVSNAHNLLPFVNLDTTRFASVSVSPRESAALTASLSQYAPFKHFKLPFKPAKESDWLWTATQASQYDVVVVAIHDMNSVRSRNYGVSPATVQLVNFLSKRTKVVVCAFGNPYGLRLFDEMPNVICGYEDEPEAHKAMGPLLFGAIEARGQLPVSASRNFPAGKGFLLPKIGRLGYAPAEEVGMSSGRLERVDEIARYGIEQAAYPGCQVLVARKGSVVYHKAFGNLRYGLPEPVTNETIYDLASVTKVAATLQAVMLLNERGLIDMNQTASSYLPELQGTNKAEMLLGEILMHQAGLKSFIPFWVNTKIGGSTFRSDFYSFQPADSLLRVADNLFIQPAVKDSVWRWVIDSPLNASGKNGYRYVYSDLGLLILQKVVERVANQPLNEFVEQNIYEPLGMTTTLFNPLERFPKERIAPTETDYAFRGRSLQGTVHDPNAALLGGVAGHAGLFSTAWDLAKLLQMNLQKGSYGRAAIFFPETVNHFAQNHSSKSHRGLGWNKPTPDDRSNVASMASVNSYGHTGFTGTVVWIDPDNELIFIMLANRVFPNSSNNRLMQLEIRRKMHEAVYASLILH